MVKLIHEELTREIIGAFYTVYNEFGLLLHFGPKPVAKRFVWTGKQFQTES